MIRSKLQYLRRQQQLRNFAIYGIGQGFNLITPLLVAPYIISLCGLENFGKASFGMALSFFLIVFIDYGSDIAGTKSAATNRENPQELSRIFASVFAMKAVSLIVVSLFMTVLFVSVPFFQSEKTLYLLGLPILLGQFLNPTWFLQGIEKFAMVTVLNIFSKIIYLTGIFCCVKSPGDYIYINLFWGIGMVAAYGAGAVYLIGKYGSQLSRLCLSDINSHMRSGFSMFSSQIFVSLQLYSPQILLGFFGTPTILGMYRVVEQVIVIFKTYILLFFNFVYPRVCFLLVSDIPRGRRFWLISNGANFLFILFAMGAIWLMAEPVIAYFHPGENTSLVELLRIGVFLPLFMAVSVPLKQLLLGFEFTRYYIRFTVISVSVMVVVMSLSIPVYGPTGVMLVLLATEFATAIVFWSKIKNRLAAS